MIGISSFFRSLFNFGKDNFYPLRYLGTGPIFNTYTRDLEKLAVIFSNPALLKVVALQCDLFSLGKFYVYDKNGKPIDDDPALDRLYQPNPLQCGSQFLWDYMFWTMIGNAYLYMTSNDVNRENAPMYFLEAGKIKWPLKMEQDKDKLMLSKGTYNEYQRRTITYEYDDGSKFEFELSKMVIFQDLTNGVGNWYKGFSRIDALYKVISNSEATLDSKNINVRFAGKFLVAGTNDPEDVTRLPMSEDEKKSIEDKVNSTKKVHAIKSMVDIKRFVDDIRAMPLDQAYLNDYFIIGTTYNIPRDVLEAYASSTYENQEKARAGHVSYTLDPKGDLLCGELMKRWGYNPYRRKLVLSWDHLPFTQVFEKERALVAQTKAQTFKILSDLGVDPKEINEFLDTEFTIIQPPEDSGLS